MAAKKFSRKPIEDEAEPSIQEGIVAEPEPIREEVQATELHKDVLPVEPIKNDVPGRIVYVTGSKFSKAFALQHAKDKAAGKVTEKQPGCIMLPDSQIITAGPTYETRMSPELMAMAKAGVLQISNFGKLAKRG